MIATSPDQPSGFVPNEATDAAAARRLPGLFQVSLVRGAIEIRQFARQRENVIFTFSLPIILLLLFGQIFHGEVGHTGVSFRQYFIAGIIASGLMSATFVGVGASIAEDRDDGTLIRLAGTPLQPAAYFAGKAILAFVTALLEVAALLAVGFIFTIHFFNTHFRLEKFPMDTVIFSGRVSKTEMLHERKRWYDRLVAQGRLRIFQFPK